MIGAIRIGQDLNAVPPHQLVRLGLPSTSVHGHYGVMASARTLKRNSLQIGHDSLEARTQKQKRSRNEQTLHELGKRAVALDLTFVLGRCDQHGVGAFERAVELEQEEFVSG